MLRWVRSSPVVGTQAGGFVGAILERPRMDEDIDPERIDDAVLALLWLGLHEGWRTWKGFDWDAMDRLHRKGMISGRVPRRRAATWWRHETRKTAFSSAPSRTPARSLRRAAGPGSRTPCSRRPAACRERM